MDPPIYPQQSDCCGSGCNPCIFDIYERQLQKYKKCLEDGTFISCEQNAKNCISQLKYSTFILISMKKLTEDTNLYTFKHETCDNCKIFYKPGQHLLIRGNVGNSDEYFSRAYTLLPFNNSSNCFTVMVKFYKDGKMSNYLNDMNIGTETFWRGPYGEYEFEYRTKYILMIGQGTGVAPFYTILNKYLNDSDCETFFKLYYCCRNTFVKNCLRLPNFGILLMKYFKMAQMKRKNTMEKKFIIED